MINYEIKKQGRLLIIAMVSKTCNNPLFSIRLGPLPYSYTQPQLEYIAQVYFDSGLFFCYIILYFFPTSQELQSHLDNVYSHNHLTFKIFSWNSLGGVVIKTLHFHCRGHKLWSLVRELRSCMPCGMTKKQTNKQTKCFLKGIWWVKYQLSSANSALWKWDTTCHPFQWRQHVFKTENRWRPARRWLPG